MQKLSFFTIAFTAALVSNAIAFDPASNSNPESAASREQAEREVQMKEIWNSMTPEEKAASNAEKRTKEYQASIARNNAANKAKEMRRLQAERNRAANREYSSGTTY